jgi:hypothetical protein
MVSFMLRPPYIRKGTRIPIEQETGWAPQQVSTVAEKISCLSVIRMPHRRPRSPFITRPTLITIRNVGHMLTGNFRDAPENRIPKLLEQHQPKAGSRNFPHKAEGTFSNYRNWERKRSLGIIHHAVRMSTKLNCSKA